jgi:arsenate reductase
MQMDRVYFLSSCTTCQRILRELPSNNLCQIDVKQQPLLESDVDNLGQLAGSFEALFNKNAILFKTLELRNKTLQEPDYKTYLLQHYTFLRRPVFVIGEQIFIGNKPEVVARIKEILR